MLKGISIGKIFIGLLFVASSGSAHADTHLCHSEQMWFKFQTPQAAQSKVFYGLSGMNSEGAPDDQLEGTLPVTSSKSLAEKGYAIDFLFTGSSSFKAKIRYRLVPGWSMSARSGAGYVQYSSGLALKTLKVLCTIVDKDF